MWAFGKTERAEGMTVTVAVVGANWAAVAATIAPPWLALPGVIEAVAPWFLVAMLFVVAPYKMHRRDKEHSAMLFPPKVDPERVA